MAGTLIPLAPVLTEMAIRNSDDYQVWDRSYRIRNNEGQMRTDRFAAAGVVLGFVGSAAAGATILPGLMAGLAVGTVSSGIYGNFIKKKQQ